MIHSCEHFVEIFKKLGLKSSDNYSISFSALKLIALNKNLNNSFNIKNIIDALKKIMNGTGVFMFDAFSWDFCSTGKFDYYKSLNKIGSLSKLAIKDGSFLRSKNPIYSFMVYGKNKKKICDINHYSCFSLEDSPFGYMINNSGYHLFIDVDFRAHAYVHVAEQKVGVDWRYFKKFTGIYTNKYGENKNIEVEMYVRDLKKKLETHIDKEIRNILIEHDALKEIYIENIYFCLIDLKKMYDLMVEDLNGPKKLIYPIKSSE